MAVATILRENIINSFLDGVILINPSLDYYSKYESKNIYHSDYLLDTEVRVYFAKQYLNQDSERKNILVSPVLIDKINNFPRSLIVNSYFDPMRDESIEFYNLLKRGGIEVDIKTIDSIHGFLSMNIEPYASDCFKMLKLFIGQAL